MNPLTPSSVRHDTLSVLMVTPSYIPAYVYGGPTRSMAALSEHLSRHGMQVEVYTTNANGKKSFPYSSGHKENIHGVDVTYYRRWTGDHTHFSPGLLRAVWIRMKDVDIVHVHSWWNLVTMPVVMLCLCRGISPVLSMRGTFSSFSFTHSKSGLKRFFQKYIGSRLFRSLTIHATSEKEKEEIMELQPGLQCAVVPNFIDFPLYSIPARSATKPLTLLFIGRLDRVKNLEFLIDVMIQVKEKSMVLHIIGESSDVSYEKALMERAKQAHGIHFKGHLDGEEKWEEIRHADILVLPSKTENFANVVVESLSQGTPVIVSDQVGLKHYILQYQLGWVLPLDIEEWSKTIRSIHFNGREWQDMRERAIRSVHRDFNSQKVALAYKKMYLRHLQKHQI